MISNHAFETSAKPKAKSFYTTRPKLKCADCSRSVNAEAEINMLRCWGRIICTRCQGVLLGNLADDQDFKHATYTERWQKNGQAGFKARAKKYGGKKAVLESLAKYRAKPAKKIIKRKCPTCKKSFAARRWSGVRWQIFCSRKCVKIIRRFDKWV